MSLVLQDCAHVSDGIQEFFNLVFLDGESRFKTNRTYLSQKGHAQDLLFIEKEATNNVTECCAPKVIGKVAPHLVGFWLIKVKSPHEACSIIRQNIREFFLKSGQTILYELGLLSNIFQYVGSLEKLQGFERRTGGGRKGNLA